MDKKKVNVITQWQKVIKVNDSSRNKELLRYGCCLIEMRVKEVKPEPENEGL